MSHPDLPLYGCPDDEQERWFIYICLFRGSARVKEYERDLETVRGREAVEDLRRRVPEWEELTDYELELGLGDYEIDILSVLDHMELTEPTRARLIELLAEISL